MSRSAATSNAHGAERNQRRTGKLSTWSSPPDSPGGTRPLPPQDPTRQPQQSSNYLACLRANDGLALGKSAAFLPVSFSRANSSSALRVAFKLLDPFPMFLLLGLLRRQPLVVFGEPLPHESAGFHQIVPQAFVIEIEFSAHEQLPCNLDSFLGELAQAGHEPGSRRMLLVFFLGEQFEGTFPRPSRSGCAPGGSVA